MILTTSRKPSRKTRSFAKALSRFLNWKYVQRGKISLEDFKNEKYCVISEIKGNPAFLSFYDGSKKTFEVFLSVSNVKKTEIERGEVVYFGEKYNFFNVLPARLLEKFNEKPYFLKKIVEKDEELIFCIGEEPIFKIKILGVKRSD
ncbi:MAG: rRNA maturation protein [Archaeoglobaceae archaeon]|nr:rRNA maturation protein [Archaeoglobaceae archaeon]MDW8117486.1 rRNA maturation protein [Archaeoglobaceae archaeon]